MKSKLGLSLLATALLAIACAPKKPALVIGSKYPLRGEVVKVNAETSTVLVAHEAIADLMPAMTMEFRISPAEFGGLKPDQWITGQLVVVGEGKFDLRKITPFDPAQEQLVSARAKELQQDTFIRGRKAYREIGESAPEFALLNQDGKAVEFSQFRGKRVVMNFIYTRCPVPTMCPLATAHMMELQRAAKAQGVSNLELVSISFDPSFDTPPVLKEYAKSRGVDTSNFTFLTGPENAIRNLLVQFGVIADWKENIYKHSLATILFDENGRIVHRVDGSDWSAEDFLKRMVP